MKVLLCCVGKNENKYIREYVDWYRNLGISKICLYDNNDIDGEDFMDVIEDDVKSGFVELVNVRGVDVCQLQSYEDCYDRYGDSYDWILFIDCGDEYLQLVKHQNIIDWLSQDKFKPYNIIHVNLMTYGDNDNVLYVDKPVNERFPQPLPMDTAIAYDFPENDHISSIVRGGLGKVYWRSTPHTPYPNNFKCCGSDGSEVKSVSPFNHNGKFDEAYFKHYTLKTAEEYANKMKRGFPDQKWDGSRIRDLVKNRFFKANKITQEKIDVFKRILGIDFSYLIGYQGEKSKNIKIYSLCFSMKDFDFLDNKYVTPLQVGADVSKTDVCDLKDNTGDNISEKNYLYIENTGTYWIWKNVHDCKYKGQMQYRRPLEGIGDDTDFEKIFSDHDVITCKPFNHPENSKPTKEQPMCIPANTVEEGYAFSNCGDDLYVLEMYIKMKHKDYSEDYDKYIKKGENLYYSNGFIMRAEDYDRYCEFLFDCLKGYLSMTGISNREQLYDHVIYNMKAGKYKRYQSIMRIPPEAVRWQTSILGFLSERIWTLWLQHNFKPERILELPYVKMEEGMYT